jgi:hypothetical protein
MRNCTYLYEIIETATGGKITTLECFKKYSVSLSKNSVDIQDSKPAASKKPKLNTAINSAGACESSFIEAVQVLEKIGLIRVTSSGGNNRGVIHLQMYCWLRDDNV